MNRGDSKVIGRRFITFRIRIKSALTGNMKQRRRGMRYNVTSRWRRERKSEKKKERGRGGGGGGKREGVRCCKET